MSAVISAVATASSVSVGVEWRADFIERVAEGANAAEAAMVVERMASFIMVVIGIICCSKC